MYYVLCIMYYVQLCIYIIRVFPCLIKLQITMSNISYLIGV
jgi:hypothetical protein